MSPFGAAAWVRAVGGGGGVMSFLALWGCSVRLLLKKKQVARRRLAITGPDRRCSSEFTRKNKLGATCLSRARVMTHLAPFFPQ